MNYYSKHVNEHPKESGTKEFLHHYLNTLVSFMSLRPPRVSFHRLLKCKGSLGKNTTKPQVSL